MTEKKRAMVRAGSVVGDRYRLTGLIGRGGFGRVFSAEHLHMKRALAVKILDFSKDDVNHAELSERFTREAESAAKIDHPNVVTIYDFGFTSPGKQPYIAMQLLEGEDLDHLLRRGPLEPERAVRLILGCLDALAEAHRLGIVHKDLKPGNLFVVRPETRREKICIVDFGLAFAAHARRRLTSQGQFVGTPQFAPPEYLEHQITTPSLDVYQVALILVEMLTGRPVLSVKNFYRCVMAHCNAELPMPVALMESPLGEVLRTALAVDYKARYKNAMLFRDALEAIDLASIPKDLGSSPTLMLAEYVDVPSMSSFRKDPKVSLSQVAVRDSAVLDSYPVTVNPEARAQSLDPVATLPTMEQYHPVDETVLLGVGDLPPVQALDTEQLEQTRPSALQVVPSSVIRRALEGASEGPIHTTRTPRDKPEAPQSMLTTIIVGAAVVAFVLMVIVLALLGAG